MTNKFNIDIHSRIIELQSEYLFDRMFRKFKDKFTKEEIMNIVSETIQRYYRNLGRPLLIPRYAEEGHLPFLEEYNQMIDEIYADITILNQEINRLGNILSDHFNHIQSERLRLSDRIKGLAGLTSDLNLLANENTENAVHIRDSFTNEENIEPSLIIGRPAQISTREGIVTLAREGTINQSTQSTIKLIQGDGEKGTSHLVKRTNIQSMGDQFNSNAIYLSEQMPNDIPDVILDGRPDTIFEYQMVNIKEEDARNIAKGYDLEWAKGAKVGDRLRLKLVIELKDTLDINWININPYHPPNSTGKVVVYSIRTSEDGFDYQSLYSDGSFILNSELNITPQTYRQDEIFNGDNSFNTSKFAGQGVWSFATRKAKFVEIVFDQTESYEELIGHTFFERINVVRDPDSGEEKEIAVRIPSSNVPDNIINAPTGKHIIRDGEYIRKGIDIFKGWRYAIGIRDINIMSYQFAEKSELVTKKFHTQKPIKQIMLYANEKIPEEFLDKLEKTNDWIKYYISIDDVNWHRISPAHQSPAANKEFPPKLYEINPVNVDVESAFKLYKGHLESDQLPTSIRLKIILERPNDLVNASSFTPILEDYSLRLVFEEENR